MAPPQTDGDAMTKTALCTICFRQFNRIEHLQRHALSHSNIRSFQCCFCSANFVRRDALIRHWRTCKQREASGCAAPELERHKRGRKRQSCDQCAKQKRKCSRTAPCAACIKLDESCSLATSAKDDTGTDTAAAAAAADGLLGHSEAWSTLPEAFTSDLLDFPDTTQVDGTPSTTNTGLTGHLSIADRQSQPLVQDSNTCFDGAPWLDSQSLAIVNVSLLPPATQPFHSRLPPHARFTFLAHFTSTTGFASSFNCGSQQERRRIMLALRRELHSQQVSLRSLPPGSMILGDNWTNRFMRQEPSSGFGNLDIPNPTISGCGILEGTHVHPLALTCQEIVIGIRETAQSRYWHGRLRWSALEEVKCRLFFRPDVLERNLAAFWALWYPNAPIIHKPTYDAAQKPATLTAAMALIGASLAAEREIHQQALYWSDLVETWVFSSPQLVADPIAHDNECFAQYKANARVNALQAAYIMVLFLTWESTNDGKKRARRGRFEQTVVVARSLYPFVSAHGHLRGYLATGSIFLAWKAFAQKEEMIRTLVYVFLLDSAYTIFNNSPPRIDPSELCFPIACPEACFQVSSVDSWSAHVKVWAASHIGKTQPSVIDAVRLTTKDALMFNERQLLREMSSLNFFIVVSVFHVVLFHHRYDLDCCIDSKGVSHGLRNWMQAWLHRETVLGAHEHEMVGPCDAWKRIGFMRYVPEYWRLAFAVSRQHESALLSSESGAPGITLRKFDETDMTQVHDLIVGLQDVNLGEYDV